MAKPIEATPTLYGEDAKEVLESLKNVASPEEIQKRIESAKKFLAEVQLNSIEENFNKVALEELSAIPGIDGFFVVWDNGWAAVNIIVAVAEHSKHWYDSFFVLEGKLAALVHKIGYSLHILVRAHQNKTPPENLAPNLKYIKCR